MTAHWRSNGSAETTHFKEPEVKYTKLFINGEFVDSIKGRTFETVDPRNGEVIATVAEGEKEDVDAAVKAARRAFDHGPWPRMPGSQRSRLMVKFAELVEQHVEELAALDCVDAGKLFFWGKLVDIPSGARMLRYYAGAADKVHGEVLKSSRSLHAYTLKEPIGVVGHIIPWNFPTSMFFMKVAPAPAAGCTMVVKPAEQTPLSALFYAHLAKQGEPGADVGPVGYGFAFVDCAALRFWVGSIVDDASFSALGALLVQVAPKEVLYESRGLSKAAQKAIRKYSLTGPTAVQLTPILPATPFADASAVMGLIKSKGYFKRSSISWNHAFDGAAHSNLALSAMGGLIDHLSRLMQEDVLRNGDVLPYQVYKSCLRMDGQTLVNLEIFSNNADGGASGTLYKYLDNCMSCSGKRLLRSWICHPLKDAEAINDRLNVLDDLAAQPEFMLLIAQSLRKLPDLDRLLGRVKASVQSSVSLLLPSVGNKVLKQLVKMFGTLVKGLQIALDMLTLLMKDKRLGLSLTKIFKLPTVEGHDGVNKLLAQVNAAIDSDFPNYQNHDVMDSNVDTLLAIIEVFVEKSTEWSAIIYAINCIDVLRSFTVTATSSCGAMSRPTILPHSKTMGSAQGSNVPILKITGLWHPYALGESGGQPVPNDMLLGDGFHPRILLLTGPNMGGKSTLLRATCLAVVLAQKLY
ncbi:hypothetical protein SAY87_029187 [Trapa incisa]|uniref:DNA mismatch repair protein MutS core domain-containing protein n=1 Tax=Trapa incisa TaxID=236973 RepID=A0AAN7QSD0_9MYRT|nr:hypothetical protein SAY87_029187 [Trapa incisa]